MPLNSPLSVYLKRAAFLCVGYYLGIGLTPLLSSTGERTRSQRHNTPDYHAGMGTHASESALRAVVPWSGNASLAQILKHVKPGFGGNPALSVLAVKEGFLDNFSENPNGEAAEIIQIALGEDPEGVSEYLSMALKRGKLAYLSDRAPLPPVSSPVYSKLVSAYFDAFKDKWLSVPASIPRSLKMLQFQPSDTAKKFMESLAGRGDAALQLSAVLFPAETALKPASVYKALDLLHDSQTRMLLLREAYLAKSADFNTLSSKSATPAEKLLSAFFDKNSQRDLSITSMDTGEIAETVNLLGPSEKLYKMAAGCGSTDLDSLIKTEIIRKLCKSNLVAATRALANDPEAPDAAILLAIEGIGDDYTSAEAWAKRLVNPTTREEALSRLEKAKVETP